MINLTIPLYPYIPTGNIFPWDSPFVTEDIATYELNAARLFYISLGSSTGTRLMGPGFVAKEGANTGKISLGSIVNRKAAILRINKETGGEITCEELQQAFENLSYEKGDALLVATGWGDNKRWKSVGEEYVLQSPYFLIDTVPLLLSILEKMETDLLLTDCFYLDRIDANQHLYEWIKAPDWIRVPWPSDMAKAFIRNYPDGKLIQNFNVIKEVLQKVWIVAGLANCGNIKPERVSITCLPMFIEDVGETPCTVVAESE